MFSAGQQYSTNPYQQQQGGYNPGMTYPVNGMVVPMGAVGSGFNMTGNIPASALPGVLSDQAALQGSAIGANALGALCNMGTAIGSMAYQNEAMHSYYGYMNKVNDNAVTVALAQVNLEDRKLSAALTMQEEQIDFQEKIARLQSQTQVRLARIEEQYKTKRAEIYSATQAFQRRSYSSGSPFSIA